MSCCRANFPGGLTGVGDRCGDSRRAKSLSAGVGQGRKVEYDRLRIAGPLRGRSPQGPQVDAGFRPAEHAGGVLGVGAGAHSYDGRNRWWNRAAVDDYMEAAESGSPPIDCLETPTDEQRALERLMLGLRLAEGLDLGGIVPYAGRQVVESIRRSAAKLEEVGLVKVKGERIRLTDSGFPLADRITEELVSAYPAR